MGIWHLQCGLNTNMHVERMHRTLKYIYLKGKQAKRLDKTIHALMKFIRDKLIDRLIVLNKGKLTSKLKEIRARHKTSVSLSNDSIVKDDNGYIVSSSSSFETYLVQEAVENCDCQLICVDCKNICIHRYTCTCLDASIKWNMCKHIHLFCQYEFSSIKSDNTNIDAKSDFYQQMLCIDDQDRAEDEASVLVAELSKKNESASNLFLIQEKEELKKDFLQILDDVSTAEDRIIVKNALKSLKATLAAKRNLKENILITQKKSVSYNKNIEPQRRLFSTRKRKRKQTNPIKKPDQKESNEIALSLIMNSK